MGIIFSNSTGQKAYWLMWFGSAQRIAVWSSLPPNVPDAAIALQRAETLTVLDRAQVAGQIGLAADVVPILVAGGQPIDLGQREEHADHQGAGTAHSGGGRQVADQARCRRRERRRESSSPRAGRRSSDSSTTSRFAASSRDRPRNTIVSPLAASMTTICRSSRGRAATQNPRSTAATIVRPPA